MPVSAALLATTNGQQQANGNNFTRGEKTTSSVRLRKRRDDPQLLHQQQQQQGERRKNNHRHSGDFAFFSPNRHSAAAPAATNGGASIGEDFNYITFPNGVPIVQEVRVAGATAANNHSNSSPVRGGGQQQQLQQHNPIRVTMRDINIKSTRAVSASVINLHSSPPPPAAYHHNGDLNGGHNRLHLNGPADPRRPQHARSHSQQPNKHHQQQQQPAHNFPHQPTARSQQQQPEEVVPSPANRGQARRRNEKRCSSEFEFKRINRSSGDFSSLVEERTFMESIISRELHNDTGSEASQESGIFSTGSSQESPRKEVRGGHDLRGGGGGGPEVMRPRPGLGRRAITQINLKERKNSYNSALARSQENLVQMGNGGEEEREEDEEEDGLLVEGERETTIKKGLLWQQRDKIFSRWKERYFILTKDFLQCFKKETSKITDMGGFIFKIKLSEVERVELLDKRGYLTICITMGSSREGRVYLRNTEGIRDWYQAVRDQINRSKTRKTNRTSAIFADRRQNTDGGGMEQWVAQRRLGLSDSTPEVNKSAAAAADSSKERITLAELSSLYRREEEEEKRREEEELRVRKKINRLSLMTDMDLPDLGAHSQLGLDLERGIFVRGSRVETDSGNNSLNTNRSNTSTGSSKLSQPMESSFLEEEEDQLRLRITDLSPVKGDTSASGGNPPDLTCHHAAGAASPQMRVVSSGCGVGGGGNNKNVIEVRYRERSRDSVSPAVHQERRRSQHVNRLQITHV